MARIRRWPKWHLFPYNSATIALTGRSMRSVYLAGPDIFRSDALEQGALLKSLCAEQDCAASILSMTHRPNSAQRRSG